MESHKKLLSILHIVYGALHILLFIMLNLLFSTIMPFILAELEDSNDEGAMVVKMVALFVRSITFVLFAVVPLPSVIGGIAQLNNKNWGLTAMMVSGCLSLLSIPIGTALGVYTIWVYMENNKQKTE